MRVSSSLDLAPAATVVVCRCRISSLTHPHASSICVKTPQAYQQILSSSGYNVSDSNEQFAAFLSTSIANLAPGVYYQSGEDASPSGIYPHQLPPKVQTVYPWQMIGYLDTSLALLQQARATAACVLSWSAASPRHLPCGAAGS